MSVEVLLALIALAGIVLLANAAEKRSELRPLLSVGLLATNFLFLLAYGLLPPGTTPLTVGLALTFSGAATLLLLAPVRIWLGKLFSRREIIASGQDAGQTVGFDPHSPTQMTALVLCFYLFGDTLLRVALAGGLGGLAESLNNASQGEILSPVSLFVQMIILILFGSLGVGLGTRRSLVEALERLGLRAPSVAELFIGASVAIGLFWVVFLIGMIWQSSVSPDVYQEQTQISRLIAAGVSTLTGAFLLSITSAVGEEIAFRGALQPVFGLWPTAVIFALTHIQYTLTPAALVIVAAALGFGWVRKRYNTTTAIVTHFLYNFGQMALLIYSRYVNDILNTVR